MCIELQLIPWLFNVYFIFTSVPWYVALFSSSDHLTVGKKTIRRSLIKHRATGIKTKNWWFGLTCLNLYKSFDFSLKLRFSNSLCRFSTKLSLLMKFLMVQWGKGWQSNSITPEHLVAHAKTKQNTNMGQTVSMKLGAGFKKTQTNKTLPLNSSWCFFLVFYFHILIQFIIFCYLYL